jgi:hypothetical protein
MAVHIVLLLKAGQTISIFGEEERSSWKVLIVAAILTKDTGFAIDADKDLVDRIAAVVKLFLAWIAKAEARRRSGQHVNWRSAGHSHERSHRRHIATTKQGQELPSGHPG